MTDTLQIEEDLLGLIILNPSAYFEVCERLTIEDFSHARTRCVWAAAAATHARGSFTMSLLESNARDVPEDVVLPVYLRVLLSNAMDSQEVEPVSIADLADTISEYARKRRLHEEILRAPSIINDPDITAEEARARIVEGFTRATGGGADRFSGSISTLMHNAAEVACDETGEKRVDGLSTGIEEVDRLTGKWMPGDLVVLGGASGSGKSAVAMQIAWHVAASAPVIFFSLEMDGPSIAQRQLASEAAVSITRLRHGKLNLFEVEAVTDAARKSSGRRMDIRWRPRQTTAQMRSAVMSTRGRHGSVGLVVVDHNKLVYVEGKVRDRIERIAIAMDDLKALAKEAECPVLMLSQMTREGTKRIAAGGYAIKDLRPSRYDLYGGGDMEEFADVILLAHRPEMILPKVEPPPSHGEKHSEWMYAVNHWEGKGEFLAEKVRNGPPGGRAVMKWSGERTRYEALEVLE